MFAYPVHSYITYQTPARVYSFLYIYVLLVSRLKNDNVWSFNALLAPFMTSFHLSITFLIYFICAFIVHGVYIFLLTVTCHVMITTHLDLDGG